MDQWDRQYLGQGLPPPVKNYIKQNSHTQKKAPNFAFLDNTICQQRIMLQKWEVFYQENGVRSSS